MSKIDISVIIPFAKWDRNTEKCVDGCLKLKYKNFEIILLPDFGIGKKFDKRIRVIETGKVKPSVKRNIGVKNAKGKIIAFIDDDAYPEREWINKALKYLKFDQVGIVGGPNLTPKESSVLEKASGDIFSSFLGAGSFALRYSAKKSRVVNELPSCNLFVKKELFNKVNGFDTSLLTAEDAKLCFGVKKLGKKVVYAPDLIVYHHRRKLFLPHLKQVFIYGRDKAFLVKEDFSKDKLFYFFPSLFVIGLLIGLILSFFSFYIKVTYLCVIFIYLILDLVSSLKVSLKRAYLVFIGTILTHLSYGLGFIWGLLRKK
jgi:GT2 family glycosyltransferase